MRPPAAPADRPAPAASAVVTELSVTGMTCNNCARHVTEALQSVPGVHSASVALEAGRASVRWTAEAAPNSSLLVEAIQRTGFAARPAPAAADHASAPRADWHLNLWVGGGVTGALMLGEWLFDLGMVRWFQWLSFALASGVQTFCGAQFYRGAWRQLRVGNSNMDTLVALGSTTAFGYSAWALFTGAGGHLYFMEATAIITLISVGHWIEARVSARASSALRALMQLAPPTARKIIAALPVASPALPLGHELFGLRGQAKRNPAFDLRFAPSATPNAPAPPRFAGAVQEEKEVPVSELKIGDQVVLRPGDRVPVDGKVIEGESAVDEAMLTGESVPVDKAAKAELYAGTVNLNGRLVMRVTATGEATALAHIIAAVQRAQTSRAGIQRLGDRVSNVFVPIVVTMAIAAGLWWGLAPASASHVHDWLAQFLWSAHPPTGAAAGFIIAAAVLIIACPCAMGLATPAAIMAAANAAARRGILIRDGVALEKAGEVTAVIFDKTGTLTMGQPEVVKGWQCRGRREASPTSSGKVQEKSETPHVLSYEGWAAALARHSTHPISQALAKLSTEDIKFSNWQEVRGAGVEGNFHEPKGMARLGSLSWLRETKVDLTAGESFIAEWSAQGATLVGLALNNSLAALFAVRDTLKSDSTRVVALLQQQGLSVHLLTGDNPQTAGAIAKQVGIAPENVFAEVRPDQKAEFVKQLQARGERVAFVGDGINDAPALTQADLGIAVSRASDVAREAADIILLKSEIAAVPEALALARATLRTIKQNLFWAFFYNAVGVPLAALGFMSPVLCAAAMGGSDLLVIGNALRLNRRKFVFARKHRDG
ncbi:MAG: cation-translocating P-type ATPase [Verrucomicrobia bacterium]|nr:cation-translocating P-type ATPase [Verrucomicrobiota bacterium]